MKSFSIAAVAALMCYATVTFANAATVQWQRAEILDTSSPSTGLILLKDIFPSNCQNSDVNAAHECLVKAFESTQIQTQFQKLHLNKSNTGFQLVTETNLPFPLDGISYRFEQSYNGIAVEDSLINVMTDTQGQLISISFKLGNPPDVNTRDSIEQSAAAKAALSAAKKIKGNEKIAFVVPSTTVAGTQNGRLAYFANGATWSLTNDIQVESKKGCSVDDKVCRKYRVFVDAMSGSVLSITSLIDQR